MAPGGNLCCVIMNWCSAPKSDNIATSTQPNSLILVHIHIYSVAYQSLVNFTINKHVRGVFLYIIRNVVHTVVDKNENNVCVKC